MKMNLTDAFFSLVPIFLSSLVAAISSLIKFKRYNEQQEVLVQSCTILTNTLTKARNVTEVSDDLLHEYHHALELLEISLYPDVRKKFLRASQKNLIGIIKNEDCYFHTIEKARAGENITSCDSSSDISEENVNKYQVEEVERGEKRETKLETIEEG